MKKIILLLIAITILGCGTTQSLQDRMIAEHPEWTPEEVALIKQNKIQIGMTKEMVTASWGEAGYVNEMNSAAVGNTITWAYHKIFSSDIRSVTFQDEKVSMFQVSEPKNTRSFYK